MRFSFGSRSFSRFATLRRAASRFAVLCFAVSFCPGGAFVARAQLPAPENRPVVGARMPALSPDGKQLAFVYRGDIWVAPAEGGRAYSVTDHIELDAYPVFSPDGKWLAFSSVRNTNWDIFVVPVQGGAVRQMTFSSSSEIASDWSPDGKTLLFSGSRDVPNSTIFALDVATLRFHKITEDYKSLTRAAYSPDGKALVFERHGFPWMRPRYNGSAAAQLWTLDLPTGRRQTIADNERQHLWPRFLPDGKTVVAVATGEATPNAQSLGKPLPPLQDSPARTPNLWAFSLDGGKPEGDKPESGKRSQLTQFVGGSVRIPAVARQSGDIAFEYERDLYLLPRGADKPRRLTLYAGAEDKQNNITREVLTGGVQEAEISPDGKTFAFAVKGDIWTIPVEKPKTRNADDATRLTDHPGFDRDFNWSKDGKTLYFVSDRNTNDRIYAVDGATQKVRPVWAGNQDASSPKISPDGKWLGFWVAGPASEDGNDRANTGGLYVVPLNEGKEGAAREGAPKRVLALPRAVQGEFSWSPDVRWLAFTRRGVESDGRNIWIMPADGSGKAVNVTRLNAWHSQPAWSPDGKYLFFASNREGNGLYVLPLQPEEARADELELKFEKPKRDEPKRDGPNPAAPNPANPNPATPGAPPDPNAPKPMDPDPKAPGPDTPKPADPNPTAPKDAPKDAPPGAPPGAPQPAPGQSAPAAPATGDARKPEPAPFKVEIDFEDTAQRIRKLSSQYPQGDLSISDEGQIFFVSDGDAWLSSYDGKEMTRLTTGGGVSNLRPAPNGRTLFFYRNGGLFTLRVAPPVNPIAPVTFAAAWERDVRAERRAAFTQFWRTYNTRFYDGNFHGRDWAAIRDRYEPLLDGVGTRHEFATLLNMMVGELEASHSEVGAAPAPTPGPSTRHLGVYFDYDYTGPGIRVKAVPKRAPGSYAKTRIKPGEYILSIDGKDVTLDENLYKVLNDKGDKDFELLVNDKPAKEGARKVRFKALTWDEWDDIHYRNRVERLRRVVEQKSNGRIAYVHIAGMGGDNQATFDRELYEYAEGKDAVIIDVRFNGGGNISDTLINWLGTKPYGTYLPRDGYRGPAPDRGWDKPIIVLMNEHSASNAEMFPYGMRAHGGAKLVGMPTPGYVIWTGGLPLVDGTSARMPGAGVFRRDGSPMENLGEKPDVQIPLSTEDWLAERDPQLEKAIELMMKNPAVSKPTTRQPPTLTAQTRPAATQPARGPQPGPQSNNPAKTGAAQKRPGS